MTISAAFEGFAHTNTAAKIMASVVINALSSLGTRAISNPLFSPNSTRRSQQSDN